MGWLWSALCGTVPRHTKGSPAQAPTASLSIFASIIPPKSGNSLSIQKAGDMMSLGSLQPRRHRNHRHSPQPHVLHRSNYKCIPQRSPLTEQKSWTAVAGSVTHSVLSSPRLLSSPLSHLCFLWATTKWTACSLVPVSDLAFKETQTKTMIHYK